MILKKRLGINRALNLSPVSYNEKTKDMKFKRS